MRSLLMLLLFCSVAAAQCPRCGKFHPPYEQPAIAVQRQAPCPHCGKFHQKSSRVRGQWTFGSGAALNHVIREAEHNARFARRGHIGGMPTIGRGMTYIGSCDRTTAAAALNNCCYSPGDRARPTKRVIAQHVAYNPRNGRYYASRMYK